LAKGALATTAIEGNTLTEAEVLQQIEGHLSLPPSRKYLEQEVQNILDACNRIGSEVLNGDRALTVERIKDFNRQVLRGLSIPEGSIAGEIPTHRVVVGNYVGAPREDCEHLLQLLCNWLEGPNFNPQGELSFGFAVLKAVIAHLYLAWIHPFADGNGRTARLLEFQILLASGAPFPCAQLLSNHYNRTRTEYYRQLNAASKTQNILPFLLYAARGFRDEIREQIEVIRGQHLDVTWRNYVHEKFEKLGGKPSAAANRRRSLVLALSKQEEPVALSAISKLTPDLAAQYANRTSKTISRDLNALMKMGLVQRSQEGYAAKKHVILAFLPPVVTPQAELPLQGLQ
jgi:Fic family protein